MSAEQQPEEVVDPVISGLVDVLMQHCAPAGAVDFPRASAAIAVVLAEMIGPQAIHIRNKMHKDFSAELERAIQLNALRSSVIQGGKQ